MPLSLNDRADPVRPPTRLRGPLRVAVTVAALGALLAPGTAFAEGSWSSYLSGVRSGFTSRTWVDNNNDTVSTRTTLSGCSRSDGANFWLEVELRKQRTLLPDVSYGRQDVSACVRTATAASWSDPGSGTFFNQFWHYDFGTVSATSVETRY